MRTRLLILTTALLPISSVTANDTASHSRLAYFSVHAGLSPYTAVIGFEARRGHWSLTAGLPDTIGLKWSEHDDGTGWFTGVHGSQYDLDDNETIDGVKYTNKDYRRLGGGAGYRWGWKKSWDFTVSLSIADRRQEWTNDDAYRVERRTVMVAGASLGYHF